MDESRPGHPTRLPLIIDQPDLAHPVRRIASLALTTLAWTIWLILWVPFLYKVASELGYDGKDFASTKHIDASAFFALLEILPWAIGLAVLLILIAAAFEHLRAAGYLSDKRWRPVGNDRLARDAALDPDNISHWQQARILYVEHGARGRVKNAYLSIEEAEQSTAATAKAPASVTYGSPSN